MLGGGTSRCLWLGGDGVALPMEKRACKRSSNCYGKSNVNGINKIQHGIRAWFPSEQSNRWKEDREICLAAAVFHCTLLQYLAVAQFYFVKLVEHLSLGRLAKFLHQQVRPTLAHLQLPSDCKLEHFEVLGFVVVTGWCRCLPLLSEVCTCIC
jgi:hypothetical protein